MIRASAVLLLLLTVPAEADGVLRPNPTIPVYRAVDLGVLPDQSYSIAAGINNWGDVVGSSSFDLNNMSNGSHATLFTHGTTIDLGVPPDQNFSNGYGINDQEQAIGITGTFLSDVTAPAPYAALFAGGRIARLDANVAVGLAINQLGQGAGYGFFGTKEHAALFDRGRVVDLGVLPGGVSSSAYALNNLGIAVGNSGLNGGRNHAVRFDHGAITDLATAASPENSLAEGINDRGQIVGQAQGAIYHAVLFQDGAMIDLMPPGADASEATAINNQGEIVGNAVFTGDAFTTAVAWVSGHVIKLPPLQGYQNGGAVAINERGQIAGYSTTRGAGTRATLWVPESEFAPPTRQR